MAEVYSNNLIVQIFTITWDSVYLPESTQYIAKYDNNTQNLQIMQSGQEKPYPTKQSGNKLSKT